MSALAEEIARILAKHTRLSAAGIDECVPVMLAVIPAAASVPRETTPCACGGWSSQGNEFHDVGCSGLTIPDECAATGQGCSYGPHGRGGERQCRYCGAADVPRETTLPESIAQISLDLGGGDGG